MEVVIRFDVRDNCENDTRAELMVDIEDDVFEISMGGEIVMSGDWSSNLQKVFSRALELYEC